MAQVAEQQHAQLRAKRLMGSSVRATTSGDMHIESLYSGDATLHVCQPEDGAPAAAAELRVDSAHGLLAATNTLGARHALPSGGALARLIVPAACLPQEGRSLSPG